MGNFVYHIIGDVHQFIGHCLIPLIPVSTATLESLHRLTPVNTTILEENMLNQPFGFKLEIHF